MKLSTVKTPSKFENSWKFQLNSNNTNYFTDQNKKYYFDLLTIAMYQEGGEHETNISDL